MKLFKLLAVMFLLTGTFKLAQEPVYADTVCQQGCSNGYSSCLAEAGDALNACTVDGYEYDNCVFMAENQSWEYLRQQYLAACAEQYQGHTYDACYTAYDTAHESCSMAYSACYNNCPPE